jgi:hypothetical protein
MAILKIIQSGLNRHDVSRFTYFKFLTHWTFFKKNYGVSQKSEEE